ncbi:unnamed protein product [Gongylonema pulchrum]|uniref:Ovule protein n=1 Tax=Gongylonema pulchrum TaxID=637853 RepID=A0A183DFE7_9BILA|nr:unnamed protein product [Gongylonema pulchrum]
MAVESLLLVVERRTVIAYPLNPTAAPNETNKESSSNVSSESPEKSMQQEEFERSNKKNQGTNSSEQTDKAFQLKPVVDKVCRRSSF